MAADLDELRCVAPGVVAESRLLARQASVVDASDADVTVARLIGQHAEPWPEATVLDTNAPPEDVRRHLGQLLDWL
jgi:predicted kinase